MATQITHIVLANKVFGQFFQDKDRKEFFIGTVFPDIRYLKVIEKDKTHFSLITLNDVKQEKSFMAGVKFHSLVDELREKYMVSRHIYTLAPKTALINSTIKLYEDELFYDEIKDWSTILGYFNTILPQEIYFGISEESIQTWHSFLIELALQKPSDNIRRKIVEYLGFSKESNEESKQALEEMKRIPEIKSISFDFYNSFESLVS